MTQLTLLMILTSVALSVSAQLFLKLGMGKLVLPETIISLESLFLVINRYVLMGLFCYAMSMVFWLFVLTRVEVSKAYPFVGLGFIGTMVFAHYFLQEPITVHKLIGTFLVVIGVLVLAR